MATKYKDANGHWFVRFKGIDGTWKSKRCGKSATASDAETIRKLYDAQELNRRHDVVVRIVNISLRSALEEYRDVVIPRSNTGRPKGQKTIQRYKAIINNFINWFCENGVVAFSDVKQEDVIRFFDNMVNGLRRSASTVSKHRQELINFFEWSKSRGYCINNPATAIKNPKRDRKAPRYFSEEELTMIFESAKEPYSSIFKFLYLTGLRIGEVGNLQWKDFDVGLKHIIIRVIEGNKTKREEVVPLNESALRIIGSRRGANDSIYIFTGLDGVKLKNSRIYSALLSVLKKHNIANASPHTFRHTCASHLAIKGVSLYIIKEILRHASIKETEVYAHLSNEAVAAAIEMIGV